MSLLSLLSRFRRRRFGKPRPAAFESLEHRNMPAVLVDVGYHLVEPNTSGQSVVLSVSTGTSDAAVAGFDLRAQIVTAKQGPYFESVRFAGDLWNTFPHVESGGPFSSNRSLATGDVAFIQGFQARAEGTLVTFTIDTTGIPAGSYEFRLVGTQFGSSSFRRADGASVAEIIANGTLQVRSIWQNPDDPNDINGDGRITPLDVLLLLNELSKRGSHELNMPSPGEEPDHYYDVNGDGYLSPLDPLGAINCLNGLSCITTPEPILAQVTPDFPPQIPGSTSTGKPVPEKPKTEDSPPASEQTDGTGPCLIYGVDENGNPIPIVNPNGCTGTSADVVPVIVPGVTTPHVTPDTLTPPTSAIVAPLGNTVNNIPSTHRNVSTVLPGSSVDAVIVLLANELSDEFAADDLLDLGLVELFALVS